MPSPEDVRRQDGNRLYWLAILLSFLSLTTLGAFALFYLNPHPRLELPSTSLQVVTTSDPPVIYPPRPAGPIGSILGYFRPGSRAAPTEQAAAVGVKARTGPPPPRPPASSAAGAPAKAGSLAERVWELSPRFSELRRKYLARYPAIAQYEREWMQDPELRKLRDDYMLGGHDPIKFAHGLAQSKGFGRMMVKYAGQEPIQAFVREALAMTPSQVVVAISSRLNEDRVSGSLLKNLMRSLGLPAIDWNAPPDPAAMAQTLIKESERVNAQAGAPNRR